MILLIILGYILLFLLAILLLVLIVPIDYGFKVFKYENTAFRGKISWLWGLVKADFTTASSEPKTMEIKLLGFPISLNLNKEEKTKKKAKKQKEKKVDKGRSKGEVLLYKEFFNRELLEVMLSTIKKLLQRLKPRKFILKGTYGFDDPYYTGIITAMASSLYPMMRNYSTIEIVPSFGETKLEGETKIQGRIIVVLFLFIMLRLVLAKPMRRIIKLLLNKKKEEKNYAN